MQVVLLKLIGTIRVIGFAAAISDPVTPPLPPLARTRERHVDAPHFTRYVIRQFFHRERAPMGEGGES